MVSSETKLNKYVRNTRVKIGLLEKTHVKAKDLLKYIRSHYQKEFKHSIERLKDFKKEKYIEYIHSVKFLSSEQKKWLTSIIPVRRAQILEWVQEKEDKDE